MTDRVPGAPGQYSAVITAEELEKLQNAQSFTITLTRDDQPQVEGTPYSKAAVLPDMLAVQLCPDKEDPTPADALQALHNRQERLSVDYVLEEGLSGSWEYRKWASGIAECWGEISTEAVDIEPISNLFAVAAAVVNFPFNFAQPPVVNFSVQVEGSHNVSGRCVPFQNKAFLYFMTTNYRLAYKTRMTAYVHVIGRFSATRLDAVGGEV